MDKGGTHEITRCYYVNGTYVMGYERRRLGEHTALHAELDGAALRITFDTGYVVEIPRDRVQFTYRQ